MNKSPSQELLFQNLEEKEISNPTIPTNIKRVHTFVSPFHLLLPLPNPSFLPSFLLLSCLPPPPLPFSPPHPILSKKLPSFLTIPAPFQDSSFGSSPNSSLKPVILSIETNCSSGSFHSIPSQMEKERFAGSNPHVNCHQNSNGSLPECFLSLNWDSPLKFNFSLAEQQKPSRGNLQTSGNPALPPGTHLVPLPIDAGFAGRNHNGILGQVVLPDAGKTGSLSRAPKKDIPLLQRSSASRNGELGTTPDDFLKTGINAGQRTAGESNAGKRKTISVSPAANDHQKIRDEGNANLKRNRSIRTDEIEPEVAEIDGAKSGIDGGGKEKDGKDNKAKTLAPPKQDYIHVRARRGQATDSHSLAERVRREKISERMKFLQDLVPGCDKVTGKAVMLDEIINYVQSLQRQVEFLSMKLATVNPQQDFNLENLLQKNIQPLCGSLLHHSVFPMENLALSMPFALHPSQCGPIQAIVTDGMENQCNVNPMESALRRNLSLQLPTLDGYGDATSQLGTFWEDDLQSVVQMGFVQNQEQTFHGSLNNDQIKEN